MKRCKWLFLIPIIISALIVGCASKTQQILKPDQEKNTVKVIAVLPVDNKTPDVKAPLLLRSKVLDELYFKGYTKLPLEVIDRKLEPLYSNEIKGTKGVVAPQVLKELVGADAVMYCTLTEGKRSVSMFYAPVTIAARCELRSAQTGEVLWNAQYKSTSRNFDFTSKRLEMKTSEAYETLMEEVVNKVMETLPDGPNLRG
jgi:hypothetical protein